MDVSENSGTPKSSILIGFSIINHPFWGTTIFGNTYMVILKDFPFNSALLWVGKKKNDPCLPSATAPRCIVKLDRADAIREALEF